jgi:glycerophosphoryl diester phosphodiesterase
MRRRFYLFSALATLFMLTSLLQTSHATANEDRLIEENFNQLSNGQLPAGWEITEGNATTQDGKLILSSSSISSPSRVLIPMPDGLGDYVFEADVTFKSAVNDARWASLMYRIQNEDYPYYQFAVRKGTSALNGIEFAIRTASNTWSVPAKTFYPEDFGYGKTYKLKVIAKGERVQQYINGQLVIDTDLASEWSDGDLGFQVSGATVEFDNVLVTTRTASLPPIEYSNAFLPEEPDTNMVNAPTVISSDSDNFTGASNVLLATELNESGNIVVGDELLSNILSSIRGKAIPTIQVENPAAVQGVIDVLDSVSSNDIHILSSNKDIIEQIKAAHPQVRGAILYNKEHLNKHDLSQLVKDANRSRSMNVVLPEHLVTNEVVYFFHTRAIAVWGIGENIHNLLHAGVDGIITGNPDQAVDAYNRYPENTLVQRPIVVSHRGVPSLAPENTMVGYQLAYDLGADLIETDVQRTKDGHLIIMHDTSVNRTTNGTGNVADLTLEEIRSLDAGIKYAPEFEGEKVPTFREFLQGFKDKDVVLLIEVKASDIEEQVLQEIVEEGMENQVVLQSFSIDTVKKFREIAPEISVGYLYSASVPGSDQQRIQDAEQMLNYATTIGARLNASYGSLSEESITYMRQRGIINMHWTFRSQGPFEDFLKKGLIGPITDYTQWLTDAPTKIDTPIKKRNLKVDQTATIQAKTFVNYRVDKKENIETTLFAGENENNVQIDGNTITALSPGQAQVFAVHTFEMLGKQWNLVTAPIDVYISE